MRLPLPRRDAAGGDGLLDGDEINVLEMRENYARAETADNVATSAYPFFTDPAFLADEDIEAGATRIDASLALSDLYSKANGNVTAAPNTWDYTRIRLGFTRYF